MSILNPLWRGDATPTDIATEYSTRSCNNMPTPYATLDELFDYADLYDVWETKKGEVSISGIYRKTGVEFAFVGRDLDEALDLALDFVFEQEWLLDEILDTHDLTFTELRALVEGEVAENPLRVLGPAAIQELAVIGQPFTVRTLAGDFLVTPVVDMERDDWLWDDELGHAHYDYDRDELSTDEILALAGAMEPDPVVAVPTSPSFDSDEADDAEIEVEDLA